MEQDGRTQPKQNISKQQASRSMNMSTNDQEQFTSSGNINKQLSNLTHSNEQRKVNDKDVDFLVKQLAIDRIKATNVLRKLDLKNALKFLIDL